MVDKNRKPQSSSDHLIGDKKKSEIRNPPAQQNKIKKALHLHNTGRFNEAEVLYKEILQKSPNDPEVLYFLGFLNHQRGNNDTSIELIGKSLNIKPDNPKALNNLGIILKSQGRIDEAIACYRQVLTLEPNSAKTLCNLGSALQDQGKLDEAVDNFQKAIILEPGFANAHYNLGNALQIQGKLNEALASFKQALSIKPDFAEVYNNLGNVLKDQGKMTEAIACYRHSIMLQPDNARVHNNLGNALKNQGEFNEAISSFRDAINLNPDFAEVYNNLANTLQETGKFTEAIAVYRQALSLEPDFPEAFYNQGNAFNNQGRLDEAIVSYRQALKLKPDYAQAQLSLGNVFKNQGKFDEAIASYQQALKLKTDYLDALSSLLFCLNYFPSQPVSQYLEEARQFGRIVTDMVSMHFSNWICPLNPKCLRVGLVSGDFRNHPVGFFLENMLGNIDPAKIDLIAYPTRHKEDELTTRIRNRFTAWKPLADLDDEAAARLIHDDGIHILLDLSGHTGHNRLPVFAWQPAPVQATWLGYFASTGIAEMDYIIADPITVPESHKDHFTEEVWYLPDIRFCFSPPVIEKELRPSPLPALRNGYITFGCFQNTVKINDAVLAAWGSIFQSLPNARLRLRDRLLYSGTIRRLLQNRLEKHGIDLKQVIFEKLVPRDEYLASHADIDIILDTFPFNGGTTTCEALWMGVPTVTLLGNTMISRQGASLLTCAGLTDWIAEDIEEYVSKTIEHASGLDELVRLRAGLRRQVLTLPLFDGRLFAHNFEEAMRGMWHRYQNNR